MVRFNVVGALCANLPAPWYLTVRYTSGQVERLCNRHHNISSQATRARFDQEDSLSTLVSALKFVYQPADARAHGRSGTGRAVWANQHSARDLESTHRLVTPLIIPVADPCRQSVGAICPTRRAFSSIRTIQSTCAK